MKKILFVMLTLMLGACTSMPQTLEPSSPEAVVLDYMQWQQNKEQKNLEVLVGGVIVQVTNLEQQSRIEVVNLPLNSAGKPNIDRNPQGRFVAYVDGFVDPLTYTKGRYISLTGLTQGIETSKVGEYTYDFPMMQATGHYLWRLHTSTYVEDDDWMWRRCYYARVPCRYPFYPRPPRIYQHTDLI